MPKLFWGQPANGSLLVQLNFMTSKTCAQVFLITQELCKEQGTVSGTSSFQQHVGDYFVLQEFCRVPFCVLCSPEVIIVACVLCFSDLSRGDYSRCGVLHLHSTIIVHRGDYCGVHHPAHHVTRGIA